jgi:hypothetical protein
MANYVPNLLSVLKHPVLVANGGAGNTLDGPAPASVVGSFTGNTYAVSSSQITNVDTRDLAPLLLSGWL